MALNPHARLAVPVRLGPQVYAFGLIHMRIELSGPKAAVENMVKNLDVQKVLGQLSEQRTKTEAPCGC